MLRRAIRDRTRIAPEKRMPKTSANVLGTDREIKAARARGSRTDFRIQGAPGLQLRVTEAGSKTWALTYKSPGTGKWAKVALGRYPSMGLAEAKGKAIDIGAEIRKGRDPIHDQKKDAPVDTFATLAARYMREHELRNSRGGRRSRSTVEAQRILDVDVMPRIGHLRSEMLSKHHVMGVVEAIADRGAYVASDRALGLIRAIYNWACGTGRMEQNPTLGLKKRNAGRARSRVLSHHELASFWNVIGCPHCGITLDLRDAYRLQLLTGARIGEVIGAPRAEVDLDRALWTIAAARTKARREHVVPLSPHAVSIFRGAIARSDKRYFDRGGGGHNAEDDGVRWIFPSPRNLDKPIDAHAATTGILRLRKRFAEAGIADNFNTHDLRRTVATSLGELGIADETIERVLNHAPRSVAGRHYNHARYQKQIRQALETWNAQLEGIVQNVPDNLNVGDVPKSVELRARRAAA